ncbi:MAG: metallophosphoesterase [Myxococcota bacterium]|nr:metallophosphoesterase [Myxococcota bacterium]
MASQRLRLLGPLWFVASAWAAGLAWTAHAQAAAGKLLKGPYLTGLSESGVEVRFESDAPAPAAVEFVGEGDAGPGRTFEDGSSTAMHVVRAVGLASACPYAYAVRMAGAVVGRGHFTTAPRADAGSPLKLLVYGDDRTDPVAHAAVVRALAATPSDVLVNTGDLVEDGARASDWQTFFDVERALLRDRALFVAIGNHELYQDSAGASFARYFGFDDVTRGKQLFGTVRLGQVRLFFLNAMHEWSTGDERRWLEKELARADDEPGLLWRIAVVHQGPWSSGPHGPNANLVAARVPELLAAHGVDLILSGHDHIYERGASGSLKYIVSGGGGAPLYRIAELAPSARKSESTYHFVEIGAARDGVRIVARRIDGSVLERCGFAKGLPWDCDDPSGAASRPGDAPAAVDRPRSAVQQSGSSRCGCAVVGARDNHERVAGSAVLASALFWAAKLRRRRR